MEDSNKRLRNFKGKKTMYQKEVDVAFEQFLNSLDQEFQISCRDNE